MIEELMDDPLPRLGARPVGIAEPTAILTSPLDRVIMESTEKLPLDATESNPAEGVGATGALKNSEFRRVVEIIDKPLTEAAPGTGPFETLGRTGVPECSTVGKREVLADVSETRTSEVTVPGELDDPPFEMIMVLSNNVLSILPVT